MKIRVLLISVQALITISANAQNFISLSGTVRLSCGWTGDAVLSVPVHSIWLTRLGFLLDGEGTFSGWIRQNHNTFLRFFNVGYYISIPQWTITSASKFIDILCSFSGNFPNLYDFTAVFSE